jgi:uncharacterized membrane protein YdjX (TVP38/TMEM64 family)
LRPICANRSFLRVPPDLDLTATLTASKFRLVRLVPLAVIVVVSVTLITMGWHKQLSLVGLVDRRADIDAFVAEHRIAALAASAGIYAVAVALSLPGAAFLTMGCGMIFGALVGGLTAIVGATAGATVIFLIAKSAFGGWLVRRAGQRAETLAAGFRADAFNYLLFLRLVPVFPFWLVNLVPAVCGVGLATFVAATGMGIIPGTFAYASFGAGLDSAIAAPASVYRACLSAGRRDCQLDFDPGAAVTPQLIGGLFALGVLALVPIAVKRFKAAHANRVLNG